MYDDDAMRDRPALVTVATVQLRPVARSSSISSAFTMANVRAEASSSPHFALWIEVLPGGALSRDNGCLSAAECKHLGESLHQAALENLDLAKRG